jgi:hypothetical protein
MKNLFLSAALALSASFAGNTIYASIPRCAGLTLPTKAISSSVAKPKDLQTMYIPSFLCMPTMLVIVDDCYPDEAVGIYMMMVDAQIAGAACC